MLSEFRPPNVGTTNLKTPHQEGQTYRGMTFTASPKPLPLNNSLGI